MTTIQKLAKLQDDIKLLENNINFASNNPFKLLWTYSGESHNVALPEELIESFKKEKVKLAITFLKLAKKYETQLKNELKKELK